MNTLFRRSMALVLVCCALWLRDGESRAEAGRAGGRDVERGRAGEWRGRLADLVDELRLRGAAIPRRRGAGGSPDLAIASERVQQAEAQVRVAGASLFPVLNLSGGASGGRTQRVGGAGARRSRQLRGHRALGELRAGSLGTQSRRRALGGIVGVGGAVRSRHGPGHARLRRRHQLLRRPGPARPPGHCARQPRHRAAGHGPGVRAGQERRRLGPRRLPPGGDRALAAGRAGAARAARAPDAGGAGRAGGPTAGGLRRDGHRRSPISPSRRSIPVCPPSSCFAARIWPAPKPSSPPPTPTSPRRARALAQHHAHRDGRPGDQPR